MALRPRTRFRPPSFARSLAASGLVHGGLVGAGIVLGIAFGFGRAGRQPREFVARFELGPEEPAFEEVVEQVWVTEVTEESEPVLAEAELWQESDPVPDEAPAPAPLVNTVWIERPPLLAGEARLEPAPTPPALAPALAPEPPRAVLPEPQRTPVVVAAVARATPAPAYPRLARRAGEQGSVLCRLFIAADGHVERVEVLESSGSTRLDEAAREGLLAWTFEPRREDGVAMPETRSHRVTFRLDGN